MTKRTILAITVASTVLFSACSVTSNTSSDPNIQLDSSQDETRQPQKGQAMTQFQNLPQDVSELTTEDQVVGTGAEAMPGASVTVHYTGVLLDGTKFDSSLDRGTPFTFELGAGEVIQGWDEGVNGMKVGGKRRLYIPYQMAYGERGIPGAIPAKAALVFDVELLKVE